MLTIGSLFSGGCDGLALGLEQAGLGPTLWQVESDPWRRSNLARHWPDAERFADVRAFPPPGVARPAIVCGGAPCQDLSDASHGSGAGLQGERSGLWFHFARILGAFRPDYAVVENVAGAASKRWVPVVRRGLWSIGYASVPLLVRACDVGAPMLGARVFVVAASDRDGESARALHAEAPRLPEVARASWREWGTAPPGALGVADGTAHRMDRLAAVGDSVMPAQAEVVGRFLIAIHGAKQ